MKTPSSDQRPTLSFPTIWLLAIIALIWFFLSLTPLPPNDLWWHMAAGRIMVDEGSLITTNRWAYTLPFDAPYVYQSWLSEVLMYQLWQIGGMPLLALSRLICITFGFGVVAWHAARRSGNPRAAAGALFIAAMISWGNWTLRPQTLAIPLGAGFIVLLGEYIDGRLRARWLALLPLITLLWVNIHGSFVLAAGLIGLTWLGNLVGVVRGDGTARRRLLPLSIAGMAVGGAILCNPLGVGIVGYLQTMLSNDALQSYFVEWQPPKAIIDPLSTGFWFFVTVLLLAVLMALGKRRPTAIDLLWFCALSWLGFGGVRYAMWFALILLPLLAERIALLFTHRPPTYAGAVFSRLYLGGLVLIMALTTPWLSPGRLINNPNIFADSGPDRWLLGSATPIRATEWLAQNPIPGRFWTNMTFTSYTIWVMPERQIFADLRVELFPIHIWEDYFAINRGSAEGLELIEQWQISHLLLSKHDHAHLQQALRAQNTWCEPYSDERFVVIARCDALP